MQKDSMNNKEANLEKRPTALEVIHGHDLHGCNAIVTGGATGIGYETVRALAQAGARVLIATKDMDIAHEATAALQRQSASQTIAVEYLDLASLSSVKQFVEKFLTQGHRLHLLINNAGIMAAPLSYTSDGLESHFAINYLGHFALTLGLLPALEAAGKARVLTLTSIAHRRSNIMFDDIHYRQRPYDGWEAYGQSSTANVLLGVAFTERYAASGITANAVMPGGIMTGIQKYVSREKQMELGWIDESGTVSPIFKTPEEGAATTIWGAVAKELDDRGGLYLQNCTIAGTWKPNNPLIGYMPYALDPINARRLWDISETLTKY